MDLILQSQRSRDLRFLKAVLQFNIWIRLTLLRLACRQLPLWEPSTAVRLWLSIFLWNNYRVTLHHILHVCDKRRWNRLVEPTTWSDGLKVIKASLKALWNGIKRHRTTQALNAEPIYFKSAIQTLPRPSGSFYLSYQIQSSLGKNF